MQPTTIRKILAIAFGALAYGITMMLFHIFMQHKEFYPALLQTVITGVISGLIIWRVLDVVKHKKDKIVKVLLDV